MLAGAQKIVTVTEILRLKLPAFFDHLDLEYTHRYE